MNFFDLKKFFRSKRRVPLFDNLCYDRFLLCFFEYKNAKTSKSKISQLWHFDTQLAREIDIIIFPNDITPEHF